MFTDIQFNVLMTLGVIIILVLLLVILPLLLSIRKKQNFLLDSVDMAIKAVEQLQTTIVEMDSVILGNFKEVLGKAITIDSKQVSVKDSVDVLTNVIEGYYAKPNAQIKASNKPPRRNKNRKPNNTPPLDNNSL